jgi:transcriptional regulator with GAF, ATPase, and Fis domain
MSTEASTSEYVEALGGTLTRLDRVMSHAVEVRGEALIVGRDPQCGLAVENAKVSGIHAELTATPRGVLIRDLESKNGTFVDGMRVVEAYLARPGKISFGDVVFQFTPGRPVQVDAATASAFGPIIGATPVMKRLFHKLTKVAATELTTLITGPTGTGKELIARAIHDAGPRARRPYRVIDCASLPASVAESALFGHERGAFTGATGVRVSPFVEAVGGTVFLDEIGELPLDLQPMLLRVLQEQEIKPVGSNQYQKVNVRILAGTHRDLRREANTSSFRSDLYFRLAVLPLDVPPLRDRQEDIPLLLAHFARQLGTPGFDRRISGDSLNRLMRYDWPGNVRELWNLLATAIAFSDPTGDVRIEEYISAVDTTSSRVIAAADARSVGAQLPIFDAAEMEFQRSYWSQAWTNGKGNISKIAHLTGAGRETVRRNLAKYGLRSTDA